MSSTPPPRRNKFKRSEQQRSQRRTAETASAERNNEQANDDEPLDNARRMRRRKKSGQLAADDPPDTPIEHVARWLYGLIACFGWCAMANAYHSETVGRPTVVETSSDFITSVTMIASMTVTFVTSSLVYLLSLPSVFKFVFTEKLSIPIVMLLVVLGVFYFVRITNKVAADLETGYEKSKHRRSRK